MNDRNEKIAIESQLRSAIVAWETIEPELTKLADNGEGEFYARSILILENKMSAFIRDLYSQINELKQ